MTDVKHGTAHAYDFHRCRCTACRYGKSAARRKRRPRADPEVVKAHVRALSEAGIGYRRVAELAGIAWQTMSAILYAGRQPMASTAERILAVQADAGPAEWCVPVVTIARRLQALRAAGWTNVVLSLRVGVHQCSLSYVTVGRRDVLPATAEAVRDVYAELAEQVAPASPAGRRARTEARQRCWFPPIAWEPESIDDPDALPCLLPPVEPVDRELELLVQHVFAGHPVEATPEARLEIVRRMPDQRPADIAPIAQCTAKHVSYLRRQLEAS